MAGEVVRVARVLRDVGFHAVHNLLHGNVDLVNRDVRKSRHQLGVVEGVVGTTSLEDLGLLIDSKVLPSVSGVDDLLVEAKHLIVRNSTGVAEIVNSGQASLGHDKTQRKELREDGHRVGHVDNLGIV